MFFVCASVDCFMHVLLGCLDLGLICLVPSQAIGWEERLRNYLFRVEWNVKERASGK